MKTNIEFVSETLMGSSVVGLMAQLIVITAIDTYTEQVVKMGLPAFRKTMKGSFIHVDSWFKGCEEIQQKLKNRSSLSSR